MRHESIHVPVEPTLQQASVTVTGSATLATHRLARSKRKRKKDDDADVTAAATPRYRMMFSLYRREVELPPVSGEEVAAEGKHLTFCMAPEVR